MNKLMKKMAVITTAIMMVQPSVCTQAAMYEHVVGTYHTSTYYDNKNIVCNGSSEDFNDTFYYDGPVNGVGSGLITNKSNTNMYYMIIDPSGKRIVYDVVPPETGISISIPFNQQGTYRLYMFDETVNDGHIGTASVHVLYKWSD